MLKITKASAGSGKTYALAQEYITLALGKKQEDGKPVLLNKIKGNRRFDTYSSILAITFTNKATEEMKQRIVKELYLLADGLESNYLKDLTEYYHATEEEVRDCARIVMTELLFNFSNFNVSTIDSFFQNILRTFTRELEMNDDFGIEMNDKAVIMQSIHNIVSNVENFKDAKKTDKNKINLKQSLLNCVRQSVENGSNFNIFRDGGTISDIAKFLSSEDFKCRKEDFEKYFAGNRIETFIKNLEEERRRMLALICGGAKSISKLLSDVRISSDDVTRVKTNKFYKALLACCEEKDYSLVSDFLDGCNAEDPMAKLLNKKGLAAVEAVKPAVDAVVERMKDLSGQYTLVDMVQKDIFAISLLGDVYKNMVQFVKDNNVMLLSNTNEVLSSIIKKDDVQFIYERVGIYLSHFLLDEFQDTSRMQWDNLRPLLEESLSCNFSNLIIGDVKQSIYRFRNAEPDLLQHGVQEAFGPDEVDDGGSSTNCSTNYRSFANIVKFNNTFFMNLAGLIGEDWKNRDITDYYSNVIQKIKKKKKTEQGYVCVENITVTDDTDKKPSDVAKERTLQIVNDALARGYRQKDIAVLVSTNKEGAEIVNYLLNQEGNKLNVVSDEALLLGNAVSVNIILGILDILGKKLMTSREDTGRDLSNVIANLHRNIANSDGGTITSVISPDNDTESLVQQLYRDEISLYEIVEKIVRYYVPESTRKSECAYILAFQDVVLDYCAQNLPTITAFLNWWDLHGDNLSIASQKNSDAVSIMTVHKSKGLEFPIVIIPFADWEPFSKQDRNFWVDTHDLSSIDLYQDAPPMLSVALTDSMLDTPLAKQYKAYRVKQIIDWLNKTYVAFTRAGEEMYILTDYKPAKSEKKTKREDAPKLPSNLAPLTLMTLGCGLPQTDDDKKDLVDDFSATKFEEAETEPGINISRWHMGEPVNRPKAEDDGEKKSPDTVEIEDYGNINDGSRYEIKTEFSDAAIEEGKKMHKIMSMIRTADEVELMVRRCAAKGLVRKADVEPVIAELSSYVTTGEPAKWFAKGNRVINERPMHGNGKNYRGDRIVVTPEGETIVVDYKFGEAESNQYISQVRTYMKILSECGFKNLTGKVWYVKMNKIVTVDFDKK